MLTPQFATPGMADIAGLMIVYGFLLWIVGGGILLVAASVFRRIPLAWAAVAVCGLLGLVLGPLGFSAPPGPEHSDNVDAWFSYNVNRSLGWYGIGAAVSSVGCLGLTWSAVSRRRSPAAAGKPWRRLLGGVSGVVLVAGGVAPVVFGPLSCFCVLLPAMALCLALEVLELDVPFRPEGGHDRE